MTPLLLGALLGATPAGFVDNAVFAGARAPAEMREALRPLAADLQACVAAGGAHDVIVEVDFAAAGAVAGAAVVASAGDARVAIGCVLRALEPITLKDRGREPPSQALLRFSDQEAPAPLPWPALKKALKRSHAEIQRCVVRLRRVQPGLRGAVVARVALDDRGSAVRVDVTGDNAGLNGCVQGSLQGVFVDGFGGFVVVAPFAFDDVGVDPRDLSASEHRTLFSFIGCDLPIP